MNTNESSTSLQLSEQSYNELTTLKKQHILSVNVFTRTLLDSLFTVATHMKQIVESDTSSCDYAKGKILTTIFYEPSTRTSSSFQASMYRLGGQVINISDVSNSSVSKGETLEDTMQCLQCYSDVIVLRHPQQGSALRASSVLNIPLINAGDGIGEHPTQALLDLYTILQECGKIDGLTITMCGDLKNGRTVHSLAKLLTRYNIKINYVSPIFLRMPDDIKKIVQENGIQQQEYEHLEQVLQRTDVLYGKSLSVICFVSKIVLYFCFHAVFILCFSMFTNHLLVFCCFVFIFGYSMMFLFPLVTRVQKERFTDLSTYEQAVSAYQITPELLEKYQVIKQTLLRSCVLWFCQCYVLFGLCCQAPEI